MHRTTIILVIIVLFAQTALISLPADSRPDAGVQYHNLLSSGVLAATQESIAPASQAGPSATIGQDVQVTTNTLAQNEPSIAINPLNSENIFVGANDPAPGFPWLGAYRTLDGGSSWTRGFVNTTGVLGSFEAASDPAVVFDGNGNLYYAGVVFNVQGGTPVDGAVFVAKSTNGGVSFSRIVVVAQGSSTVFNDKPYIGVNEATGRVYVSWTRFRSNRADIMVSFSSNGGTSFSTPVKVSTSTTNQGSIPVVGPNGELYVAWSDLTNDRIVISKSLNRGVSFSSPVTVSDYVPLPDCQPSCLPNSRFRVNNFPTAAVDDSNGNVYVSWADYGTGDSDILFSRSVDGGSTWSTPFRVNDDRTTSDQFFPWMAASSGGLDIVFYDRRLDPDNHLVDVFSVSASYGGLFFTPNLRVSDVSSNPDAVVFGSGDSFIGDYIGVASNGTVAYAVWTDTRDVSVFSTADENIYFDSLIHNIPPTLEPITNKTIGEGNKLTFEATATDPDTGEHLNLTAQNLPAGATFSSDSSTNRTVTGSFNWTPDEEQGPGSYTVEILASDGFSTSSLNVSLTVDEVNAPPVLVVPGTRTVGEGSAVTFTVNATDSDIPANNVSLLCENCASLGASFNASTGRFTWTPTEEQGPGSYMVEFRATDDGVPPLSDLKSVVVQVMEADLPPILTPVSNQTIDEDTTLSFQASATDPDLPRQTLTFSLEPDAPSGSSISGNGFFSWTPTEVQGPATYTFTIKVSDDFLSNTKAVTVTVNEVDNPPILVVPGSEIVQQGRSVVFNVEASDPDLDTSGRTLNSVTITVSGLPEGATFDSRTGAFFWAPSDAQSPGVYEVVFSAKESGSIGLVQTKTVTITVVRVARGSELLTSPWGLVIALGSAGVAVSILSFVFMRRRKK